MSENKRVDTGRMDGIIEALFDAFVPSTGGGGRLTRWLGTPLAIVMFALGVLGGILAGRELGRGMDTTDAFLMLLIPFGGTLLAGLAGARGAARSLVASLASVTIAVFTGACVALFFIFDGLFLPW